MKMFDVSVNSLRIVLIFILIWLIYKSVSVEYSIGSSSHTSKKTRKTIKNLTKKVKGLQKSVNAIEETLQEDQEDEDLQPISPASEECMSYRYFKDMLHDRVMNEVNGDYKSQEGKGIIREIETMINNQNDRCNTNVNFSHLLESLQNDKKKRDNIHARG